MDFLDANDGMFVVGGSRLQLLSIAMNDQPNPATDPLTPPAAVPRSALKLPSEMAANLEDANTASLLDIDPPDG